MTEEDKIKKRTPSAIMKSFDALQPSGQGPFFCWGKKRDEKKPLGASFAASSMAENLIKVGRLHLMKSKVCVFP